MVYKRGGVLASVNFESDGCLGFILQSGSFVYRSDCFNCFCHFVTPRRRLLCRDLKEM